MPSYRTVWVVAVSAGAVVCLSALRADELKAPGPAAVPFRPVQSIETLMGNQDLVFKQIKATVMDAKWDDAEGYAWLLAELANVNRQFAPAPRYAALAGEMSERCVELVNKLKGKDARPAAESISQIARACEACHDEFRKEH